MKDKLLQNYFIKNKFFISLFIAIFIVSIVFSVLAYQLVDKEYESKINSKLKSAALNTALILGDNFFERAYKGKVSKNEDINNTFILTKLANNEGVRYVYSMIEKNGTIYFTSSSATKEEIKKGDLTAFMQAYPEASYKLRHIFDINHSFYEVSTDRWGTFKSILIPKYTKSGIPYIVGADIQINDILEAKKRFLYHIVLMNMLFLVILLIFAYKSKKLLTQEMETINNIQKALEEEINKKTKALQELNNNLEKRVEEEVKKSREKDKKLIVASRLAQKGEELYMLVHQWAQPINSLLLRIGLIDILLKENSLEKKDIKECVDESTKIISHLAETMKIFKSFFKKDNKKEEIDINKLVEDVIKLEEEVLKYKNISYKLDLHSQEKVNVYKNEIIQVLIDLIKNSIDEFENRNIEKRVIRLKTDGKKIIYEDNAGGIPENIKDKIFDFHFTTKENGTGLGLYMSKIIIEEHHNGKIEVENIENGVRFIINLHPFN